MTFLGLEQPIDYGRQQVFDPSTAQMVLDAQRQYMNAVYNDYQQGLQEMKDFKKEYGDFMSPIAADQEWWDQNVTGPVRNLINEAYKNGVDLLRSPQGRAMVSQMINSRNYGEISKKRIRANNAEQYYKNMAALKLNNRYSEDFSRFLREDPNQWALDDMGVTSPTVFQSLKDATNDWYNNRTARDLTAAEINALGLDPRYQYKGFSDSDLMNIAKGQTPGWQGTPAARYYRHLAEQKLIASGEKPTAERIEEVLQRDIANAQQEWLIEPTRGQADQFAVLDQQLRNNLTAQRQSKQLDYYYKMMENGADINGDMVLSKDEIQQYSRMKQALLASQAGYSYDTSTGMYLPNVGGAPIEFTDYRRMGADDNRRKSIIQNTAGYIQQMIAKEQADIDAYNSAVKENKTGTKDRMDTKYNYSPVPGAGLTVYQTPSKDKVTKHSDKELAKLKKRANAAKFNIYMYNSYLNEDGSVNYKKMMERGYFDSNGNPTEMFMKEINKLNKANKYLPENQRAQRAEDTYMLYTGSAPTPGTAEHDRLVKDFGGTNIQSVPGLPNKMRKIELSHYKLSAIHRGDITGANVYDQNSNVRRAQEWFANNKIDAFVDDETVNDAYIPNASGTQIINDVYGEALVDRRIIARMFDELGIKSKRERDELLTQLGIRGYEKQTNVPESNGGIDYKWVTYYSVPLTKTFNNGIVQGDRNSQVNKDKYGQATSKERERNSYSAGIQSTLN